MLTLADLRYLLRLVKFDYWEATDVRRSLRVEEKLADMISRARQTPKGKIGKRVKKE